MSLPTFLLFCYMKFQHAAHVVGEAPAILFREPIKLQVKRLGSATPDHRTRPFAFTEPSHVYCNYCSLMSYNVKENGCAKGEAKYVHQEENAS
jgi:hypothetical protein